MSLNKRADSKKSSKFVNCLKYDSHTRDANTFVYQANNAVCFDDLRNAILKFEYLHSIIAMLPNLAYLKDVENNRFVYINTAFKKVFLNESIIVSESVKEKLSMYEKQSIKDNREILGEKISPIIHPDGTLHELTLNFYPLYIESKELKYLLAHGNYTTKNNSSSSQYLLYKNYYSDEKNALNKFLTAIGLSDYLDGKKLTLREYDCLIMLSKGLSVKEIARVFDLSNRTVENHIMNIKEKFSVTSNIELLSIFLSCYKTEI